MEIHVDRKLLMFTTQQVRLEMKDTSPSHYFNNFHGRFQGGFYRNLIINTPTADMTYRHFLEGFYQRHPHLESRIGDHSEAYLVQTPREFFGIIDEIVRLKRISKRRILELERVFVGWRELHNLVLPVYIYLRALGYNHLDLTS